MEVPLAEVSRLIKTFVGSKALFWSCFTITIMSLVLACFSVLVRNDFAGQIVPKVAKLALAVGVSLYFLFEVMHAEPKEAYQKKIQVYLLELNHDLVVPLFSTATDRPSVLIKRLGYNQLEAFWRTTVSNQVVVTQNTLGDEEALDLFEFFILDWMKRNYDQSWLVEKDEIIDPMGLPAGTRRSKIPEEFLNTRDVSVALANAQKKSKILGSVFSADEHFSKPGFAVPANSKVFYDFQPTYRAINVTTPRSSFTMRLTGGGVYPIFAEAAPSAYLLNAFNIGERTYGAGLKSPKDLRKRQFDIFIEQKYDSSSRFSQAAKFEFIWAQSLAEEIEEQFGWSGVMRDSEILLREAHRK